MPPGCRRGPIRHPLTSGDPRADSIDELGADGNGLGLREAVQARPRADVEAVVEGHRRGVDFVAQGVYREYLPLAPSLEDYGLAFLADQVDLAFDSDRR